jgi:hypothetical protein
VRIDLLASLRRLSDAELVARVKDLANGERSATVLLVAHLAELDTRDVHLRAGHGSLFAYCRDALALSEQETYNRIAVARAARRFPVILEMLEGGALNVTTVRLLSPHLTRENHLTVLESARGKSKLQVEEIAARLWPLPDVPSYVRKLPAPRAFAPRRVETRLAPPSSPVGPSPIGVSTGGPSAGGASPVGPSAVSPSLVGSSPVGASPGSPPFGAPQFGPPPSVDTLPPPVGIPQPMSAPPPQVDTTGAASTFRALPLPPAKPSAEVTPLSPDRYKVQVTISGDTFEKLRLAKDLLRHAVPSGDEAAILDRALTALLADLAQRKFAAAEKPRPSGATTPGSRHIPAEVKRAVWLRDLGRCAFVGTNGRRCPERGFLEFHHIHPHALGGEPTAGNIQLRCRAHNAYEARVCFGRSNGDGGGGYVREEAVPYGFQPEASASCILPQRLTSSPRSSRAT